MKKTPVVNLMIIGAQKSATSSLFDLLKSHPQMAPCLTKEPQFFSHDSEWRKHVDKYEAKFPKKIGQIAFEASTSYSSYPHHETEVWKKIHEYNPDAKIIYILRNPVDRIISGHRFLYKRGFTGEKNINKFLENHDYHINLSKYYLQIHPYIETFGSENVQILFFEDFVENIDSIKMSVANFLQIDVNLFSTLKAPKTNTKERTLERVTKINRFERLVLMYSKKISFRLHQKIRKTLLVRRVNEKDLILTNDSLRLIHTNINEDIKSLETLTQRDLSNWKKKFQNL